MLLKLLRNGLGGIIVLVDRLTRPKPLQRSPEAQVEVERAAQGLTLYEFYACPFCIKTRRAIHRLNVPVATRDAKNDPGHREALRSGGGKIQVPCLRIDEDGATRWMYESGDIIDYLEGRFGPDATQAGSSAA